METADKYQGLTLDHRYQLLRLLGKGGMGSVYVARHVLIGKQLAVKILEATYLEDETTKLRLFREAEAAAAVGHPNIIDVVDVGMTELGDPYLVMELLEGEDLCSFLEREGPVTVEEACAIVESVLRALEAAHDKQVVHRDIKPANIFLQCVDAHRSESKRLPLKLIDFGIAKMGGPTRAQLTTDGALLGTPSYMSPEQAKGSLKIDARTDLYGVGMVLYEILTGRLPYTGNNYNEIIQRIANEDFELESSPDRPIPSEVLDVIRRSLSKAPEARFQTAREMLAAIAALPQWGGRREAAAELSARVQVARVPSVSVLTETQVSPGNQLAEHQRSRPYVSDLESQIDTRDEIQNKPTPAQYPEREVRPASVPKVKGADQEPASGALQPDATQGETSESEKSASASGASQGGRDSDPSASRRGWLWLAAALAVVGVGLGVAMRETSAPAVPEPAQSVQITLSGLPNGARVFYAGQRQHDNPFVVKPTEMIMPLRVEMDGYAPFDATIVPSMDRTLQVSLRPAPSADAVHSAPKPTSEPAPEPAPEPSVTAQPNSANQRPVRPRPSEQQPDELRRSGRDSLYFEKFE